MSYFIYISLFIVALYALTLFVFAFAWFILPRFTSNSSTPTILVSIIIPARNEEENITCCIESLIKQNYPNQLAEIILVDDNSTDKTVSEAEKFLQKSSFNYTIIKLNANDEPGKKAALTRGVDAAFGQLIVTIDADSFTISKNWLNTIVSFYERKKSAMIISPIVFPVRKGFLHAFQQTELMGLTLSAAGSAIIQQPIICSGANLAFERSAFYEVGGYKGNEHIASGDDIFLLNKIRNKFPKRIHYLKSAEALIETNDCDTISELLNQRLRWAGKIKANSNLFNFYLGALVFTCNLLFVVFAAWSCFFPQLAKYLVLIAGAKWLIDFLLVFLATLFLKHKRVLWWFPIAILINPLYVCLIGVLSLWLKPVWKGRKIN